MLLSMSWAVGVVFLISACNGDVVEASSGEDGEKCQSQGVDLMQVKTQRAVMMVPKETESDETGDESMGVEGIKKLVRGCLAERMALAEGDEQKKQKLRLVERAEVYQQIQDAGLNLTALAAADGELFDDPETVAAAIHAGKDAAVDIARAEFESDFEKALARNLTAKGVEHFKEKIDSLVQMCGKFSPEINDLGKEATRLLDKKNWTQVEAEGFADDLYDLDEKCRLDVLNLDFFVKELGPDDVPKSCPLIASHSKAMRKERMALNEYYAKVALAVHTNHNRLGHRFVAHLSPKTMPKESVTKDTHVLHEIHAAIRSSNLSEAARAHLWHVEQKHRKTAMGWDRDEDCRNRENLIARKPDHWMVQNKDLQDYYNCLCGKGSHPAIVCEAKYEAGLAKVSERVGRIVLEAKGKLNNVPIDMGRLDAASLLAAGTNTNVSSGSAFIVPCADAVTGKLCVKDEALCLSTTTSREKNTKNKKKKWTTAKTIEADLNGLFSKPVEDLCGVYGEIGFCANIVKMKFINFNLKLGAEASVCSDCNGGGAMANFRIWAKVDMCFNDKLKGVYDILASIGLECRDLAGIEVWPFLNKIVLTRHYGHWPYRFKIDITVILSAKLADGVYWHCKNQGNNRADCLRTLFDAQGTWSVGLTLEHGFLPKIDCPSIAVWECQLGVNWQPVPGFVIDIPIGLRESTDDLVQRELGSPTISNAEWARLANKLDDYTVTESAKFIALPRNKACPPEQTIYSVQDCKQADLEVKQKRKNDFERGIIRQHRRGGWGLNFPTGCYYEDRCDSGLHSSQLRNANNPSTSYGYHLCYKTGVTTGCKAEDSYFVALRKGRKCPLNQVILSKSDCSLAAKSVCQPLNNEPTVPGKIGTTGTYPDWPKGCFIDDYPPAGLLHFNPSGGDVSHHRSVPYCYRPGVSSGCVESNSKYTTLPKGQQCPKDQTIIWPEDCAEADRAVCRKTTHEAGDRGTVRYNLDRGNWPKGCFYDDHPNGGLQFNKRMEGFANGWDPLVDGYSLCWSASFKCGCKERTEKYVALPMGSKCPQDTIIYSLSDCKEADKEVCVCRKNRHDRGGYVQYRERGWDGTWPMGCFVHDGGGLHFSRRFTDENKAKHDVYPLCYRALKTTRPSKGNAHVCADGENKVCSCNGLVFYGKKYVSNKPGSGAMTTLNQLKSSAYLSKSVQGQIDCSYHGMGGDPLGGYYKYCLCKPEQGCTELSTLAENNFNDRGGTTLNPSSTYTYRASCGYTIKLTGWTHTRSYAKGFLRNTPGDGKAVVEGLAASHAYKYKIYQFASSYAGTNEYLVNGVSRGTTTSKASDAATATGQVEADGNGKVTFTFIRQSRHVHLSGIAIAEG